jgi:UDP-2-acetamido-3-amino-2,3-dideoxy-glucuronate N-acetyltransferase
MQADVPSSHSLRSIGPRTVVHPSAKIERGVVLGADCRISEGVVISEDAIIHDGVTVEAGASVGARSIVQSSVVIGEGAVVESDALVTRGIQPHAIAAGNPARVRGFMAVHFDSGTAHSSSDGSSVRVMESKVRGVRAYQLPFINDPRGNLTVGEFGETVPFVPLRYFVTFDIPNAELRGEHAHFQCQQFLICMRGSCAVVVDDGVQREEFLLDRPTFGVYVPPMVWATEYKHSHDSTLTVFASHHYDPADYIRDYKTFLSLVSKA